MQKGGGGGGAMQAYTWAQCMYSTAQRADSREHPNPESAEKNKPYPESKRIYTPKGPVCSALRAVPVLVLAKITEMVLRVEPRAGGL